MCTAPTVVRVGRTRRGTTPDPCLIAGPGSFSYFLPKVLPAPRQETCHSSEDPGHDAFLTAIVASTHAAGASGRCRTGITVSVQRPEDAGEFTMKLIEHGNVVACRQIIKCRQPFPGTAQRPLGQSGRVRVAVFRARHLCTHLSGTTVPTSACSYRTFPRPAHHCPAPSLAPWRPLWWNWQRSRPSQRSFHVLRTACFRFWTQSAAL